MIDKLVTTVEKLQRTVDALRMQPAPVHHYYYNYPQYTYPSYYPNPYWTACSGGTTTGITGATAGIATSITGAATGITGGTTGTITTGTINYPVGGI